MGECTPSLCLFDQWYCVIWVITFDPHFGIRLLRIKQPLKRVV